MYILEQCGVPRIYIEHMTSCVYPGCLRKIIATAWVEMYWAAFINSEESVAENEEMQMSAIKVGFAFCLRVVVTV
jgi:hypothetical protein